MGMTEDAGEEPEQEKGAESSQRAFSGQNA